MTRVTWAVLSAGVLVCFSGAARAEEKPDAPCPETHADAPVAVGLESEELAFERALERFARYRGFTERLVAEREARAFEDFEREVELYLAKVALTKSLAARQTGAPSW